MASNSGTQDTKKPCCGGRMQPGKLYKVSELPLYGNPYPKKDQIIDNEPGSLENGIRICREELTKNLGFLSGTTTRTKQIVETAVAHTKSTYDYISDEGNPAIKSAVIVSGGLLGLLMATRKGFIKKILYTGSGLGIGAGLCYPKQSVELVQVSAIVVKNKGPVLIKEYTGVDVNDYITLKNKSKALDNVSEKMLKKEKMPDDRDQSKPSDKDMYTTRINK